MKRIAFRTGLWLLLASAMLLGAACTPGDDAPDADRALIEAPAVGDIYAAELSAFSTATFGDEDDAQDKAYGLMKVVAVDAAKVVVITEDAASDEPRTAKRDILGDLSNISFDDEERIDIVHSQLRKAYEAGEIYEVRR